MKMEIEGDTLRVSAVKELGATNAIAFRNWVRDAMSLRQRNIEVDLSEATLIDSSGLGALVVLHKTVNSRQGLLRLLHPQPQVQQILELAQMDRLFEIVKA